MTDTEQWKLKQLIKQINETEGDGTSMISLIINPSDSISKYSKKLTEEFSAANNIKNRVNRLSVLSAIVSTQQKLKLYNRVPKNGLIIYCGKTISGKQINVDLIPYKEINTSLYMCDNKFHTDVLNNLLDTHETYGFIIMDGHGTLFGTLSGDTKTVLQTIKVDLPEKHNKGGQSAVRFSRNADAERKKYVTNISELCIKHFISNNVQNVSQIILAGKANLKHHLVKMLDNRLTILKVLDIGYGMNQGFDAAINLSSNDLAHTKFLKEKNILQTFFTKISTNHDLVIYGESNIIDIITSGACETIIVNESNKLCEWVVDNYSDYGCNLYLVTDRSPEGLQFLQGFGGIGGILRYPLDINYSSDSESYEY